MTRYRTGRKSGIAFGFATATVVLAMASVAFACTNFKGEVVAHSGSNPGLTTIAHGDGMAGAMNYCAHDGNPGGLNVKMKGDSTANGNTGDFFTVQGQGFICPPAGAQSFLLKADNYYMFASTGSWTDDNQPASADCMQAGTFNYFNGSGSYTVTQIGGPYAITAINAAWGPFTSTAAWKPPSAGPAVLCFDVPGNQTNDAAPEMNMTFI